MAEQKCLCGFKAYFVGELLTFILDDIEEGKVTPTEDIEHLGVGIRGLSYCGIEISKIEEQFDVLKESLGKMAKAETSHERHKTRLNALLDRNNLEKAIGDTLGECSK
ncbi:unnamed protein product [marine sediment metagenome]|uniref:Uncharacterized protein n=1 Tax=marine sediment metagenome TaxID=412755 RepID=X1QU23_9ZZZZ